MNAAPRWLLITLRYVLPGVVCAAAVVILIVNDFDEDSLDGAAAFLGAGLSIWLMNVLFRVGVDNEKDRDEESRAREYFDEHGYWPDEAPGRRPR